MIANNDEYIIDYDIIVICIVLINKFVLPKWKLFATRPEYIIIRNVTFTKSFHAWSGWWVSVRAYRRAAFVKRLNAKVKLSIGMSFSAQSRRTNKSHSDHPIRTIDTSFLPDDFAYLWRTIVPLRVRRGPSSIRVAVYAYAAQAAHRWIRFCCVHAQLITRGQCTSSETAAENPR